MFLFSGKPGEGTLITTPDGYMIRVVITHSDGGRTTVGVEAPKQVKLTRFQELPNGEPACTRVRA